MRDEERRYDEASQLCRAADGLRSRVESLRRRLREEAAAGPGGSELERADLERAEEAAAEALQHLRRYREKLVGGSKPELNAG